MKSRFAARALALLGLASLPVLTGFAPADTTRRAGPRAAPIAQAEADWVETTLASLDLRGRVAQMVVAWIDGGTPARAPPKPTAP